jgi:hypothetical protein
MIQYLRTQEHQYVKLSKNISNKTSFNSEFDFMMEEPREEFDFEGREDMQMIDISKEDSSEEMKSVLKKINKLTKMLTSMSEVDLYYLLLLQFVFIFLYIS